jgi:transcriptional antiterminator NusG
MQREDRAPMAKRWYSVSVLSNFEKRVAESIRDTIRQQGLEDEIEDVMVPTEDVTEVRRGRKVTVERRFMPGYVLVKMEMNERTYHAITSINRVTGFLGPQGKPTPLRDAEVARILNQVEEGVERPRPMITFEIGEQVSVTDGPFEGFTGLVEDVDEDNARLKVSVSIFGRATPVELEYTQVSKAA